MYAKAKILKNSLEADVRVQVIRSQLGAFPKSQHLKQQLDEKLE